MHVFKEPVSSPTAYVNGPDIEISIDLPLEIFIRYRSSTWQSIPILITSLSQEGLTGQTLNILEDYIYFSRIVQRSNIEYSRGLYLLYPPDSIRWILWITHGYAAAAVCRDFLVTPLEARVL